MRLRAMNKLKKLALKSLLLLIALIWKFDFSPFMVLMIAILNDGTIMTISKDRVKPSPAPDSLKLEEIFTTGVVLGGYLAMMSVIFFWLMQKTDFFSTAFSSKKDYGKGEREAQWAIAHRSLHGLQAPVVTTSSGGFFNEKSH